MPACPPGSNLLGIAEGTGRRRFAAIAPEAAPAHGKLQWAELGHRAVALAGSIVNRREIAGRLPSSLPPPESDAELVVRRYAEVGDEACSELRGQFAVAIWDGDRDTLLTQRDPMGNYSLFRAEWAGSLLLSDSLDALLQCPGVPAELNRVALADSLRDRWPDPEETFYTALRRVPAGHRLTDRSGQRSSRRVWSPAAGSEAGWASPQEVDDFEERFACAVERCLKGGSVGIWLSGGLDSVSVAAFAADRSKSLGLPPPVALSLAFPDAGVNEEDVQRSVAQQLGFPSVMLPLDEAVKPDGVIGAALRTSAEWPAPMLGPWLPAYLALGRAGLEHGCAGILTGHGGDEWLTVSPYHAADLLAAFDLAGVYRLARAARRSLRMSPWRIAHSYLWRFGTAPLLRRGLTSAVPGLLDRRDRRKFARSIPDWLAPDAALRRELLARYTPPPKVTKFYDHELRRSLNHTLVSVELEEWHEAGRRIGAPILSPFLDVDLVELLYRIHPDVLNRDGRSKGLVRSTLNHRFPHLAFNRQKKVQAFPTLERLLAESGPKLARLEPSSALVRLGVVDPYRYEAASLDALARGNLRQRWALFHVQSLEAFTAAHC